MASSNGSSIVAKKKETLLVTFDLESTGRSSKDNPTCLQNNPFYLVWSELVQWEHPFDIEYFVFLNKQLKNEIKQNMTNQEPRLIP